MTTLIALLSTGKGTWTDVKKLMEQAPWESIILFGSAHAKANFSHPLGHVFIETDFGKPLLPLVEDMERGLAQHVPDGFATEVALNIASGSGKEHMALLSAILKAGLALRLVAPGEQEVQEL